MRLKVIMILLSMSALMKIMTMRRRATRTRTDGIMSGKFQTEIYLT